MRSRRSRETIRRSPATTPEDDEYLIEKHPNVEHHEVVELGRR
jgi:hypothetical protein